MRFNTAFVFFRFAIDSSPYDDATKAQLAVHLLNELSPNTMLDQDKLLRFCLTVSKNYRLVSYHNWEHAFSVAHCMYWVIKGSPQLFTELEVRS